MSELDPDKTVRWHPDDTLVIEVEHFARQLGFDFEATISFLVGLGITKGQELGVLGPRALDPMDPRDLHRRMEEYLDARDNTR